VILILRTITIEQSPEIDDSDALGALDESEDAAIIMVMMSW
jgi:hypothetical protein